MTMCLKHNLADLIAQSSMRLAFGMITIAAHWRILTLRIAWLSD